jgi:hypothetical protein
MATHLVDRRAVSKVGPGSRFLSLAFLARARRIQAICTMSSTCPVNQRGQ